VKDPAGFFALLGGTMENLRALSLPIMLMALVVLASNILVQYPVEAFGLADYLTWGAFTYPFAFLLVDLTNRHFGAPKTRQVVYIGFVIAVVLSAWLATPRIAMASGTAFLVANLIDVFIFDKLRNKAWWLPPFLSSVISSALDTVIFFSLAFHCGEVAGGTISGLLGSIGIADTCDPGVPWQTLAVADYLVKLALAALFIAPYGALRGLIRPVNGAYSR
jgi:queuosine precursor transporter